MAPVSTADYLGWATSVVSTLTTTRDRWTFMRWLRCMGAINDPTDPLISTKERDVQGLVGDVVPCAGFHTEDIQHYQARTTRGASHSNLPKDTIDKIRRKYLMMKAPAFRALGYSDFRISLAMKLLEFEAAKRPGMFKGLTIIHKAFIDEYKVSTNPYDFIVEDMKAFLVDYILTSEGEDGTDQSRPLLEMLECYRRRIAIGAIQTRLQERVSLLPGWIEKTESKILLFKGWTQEDTKAILASMNSVSLSESQVQHSQKAVYRVELRIQSTRTENERYAIGQLMQLSTTNEFQTKEQYSIQLKLGQRRLLEAEQELSAALSEYISELKTKNIHESGKCEQFVMEVMISLRDYSAKSKVETKEGLGKGEAKKDPSDVRDTDVSMQLLLEALEKAKRGIKSVC
eukprot:Filipodium_phascolosomae@DN7972_c0_g1_i1.p1